MKEDGFFQKIKVCQGPFLPMVSVVVVSIYLVVEVGFLRDSYLAHFLGLLAN